MFDISWGKLLVIAGIALVVVGPKDLIPMLRTLGQFTAKLRQMAAEFHQQFNDALREADLAHMQEELERVDRELRRGIDPSTADPSPLRATPDEGSNSEISNSAVVSKAPGDLSGNSDDLRPS